MEYPLVIQYSIPVGPDLSSLFFRIEQELEPDDPPSVDEAAQAIDAVTGQDFCNRTVAKNGYQPPENKSPAEQQASFRDFFSEKLSDPLIAQDFAQRLGIEQPCKVELGEPITIPLKIFWQTLEIAENYRLESTSDVEFSKPVLVRENLEKEFKVSEVSEKNIEYYIEIDPDIPLWKQVEFSWIGNVVNEKKDIARGPTGITVENNSIVKWAGRVSGTFVIKFTTLYHAVQAKITPENGDYSTTVYGVWDGPAVSLDLVVPEKKEGEKDCPIKDLLAGTGTVGDVTIASDDGSEEEVPEVTCFWLTTHKLRQPCGDNELIESWKTIDQAKCPDDIADRTPTVNSPMSLGYIEEIESRYYYELGKRTIPDYISTADPRFSHDCEECTEEGFQEACCRERASVGNALENIPPCLEIKSTFYGGVEIEKGRDHWKKKYPGGVIFQEKLPEDGYCGVKTVSFEIKNCDPCKDVPELVWDEGNPQIIAPNSSVDLELTGGNYPELFVTWEITGGEGYSFIGGVQKLTAGLVVTLNAGAVPCGLATISATDGCSDAAGRVSPTNGITLNYSTLTLSPGDVSRTLYSSGGVNQKTWSTSGPVTIVSGGRTNDTWTKVQLDATACTDGSVTTTDGCGTSATCEIINNVAAITLNYSTLTLSPGDVSRTLYSSGGVNQKTWSTSGPVTIVSGGRTNDTWTKVQLDSGAITNGSVTTTDGCGTSATCEIINANI